ncbi:MAG: MoxR family ATPase [Verrucomicrobiota bacterium]|nr:MoxR family ATPase [Verrucomicrobiota bacterium]
MEIELKQLSQILESARQEAAKVIIGQRQIVDMALMAILNRGHILIEGPPGVAKTLLVRTLGAVFNCPSGRIQFTPDLMPTDITGTTVFNLKDQQFSMVKGPIFTTFLLADEINRAPAKTQSALLQCMQERSVTIDRQLHQLDPDFTVFATQNPIEYEGTYPLPEAQKDRFMFKVIMDYPERDDELHLASRMLQQEAPEKILERGSVQPVVPMGTLETIRNILEQITVRPELLAYIVEIVRETRKNPGILVGAGPRATQALVLGTRARAAMEGRDFITPDDVKALAQPVLAHRIILRPEFEIEGLSVAELIERILQQVPVPR